MEADYAFSVDVLDDFSTIKVGVAYTTSSGERITSFPADLGQLENCTVEYENFEGWHSSTKGIKDWSELPPRAQQYISMIEESVGVKVCCPILRKISLEQC